MHNEPCAVCKVNEASKASDVCSATCATIQYKLVNNIKMHDGDNMAVKIKPSDSAFSKCVRTASDWTCERCNAQHESGSMGLHCSHIYSRRHRTIRWSTDNVQALCFSCHQWFGGSPADSGAWITELLGAGHIELLREKRDSKVKVSKLEEKDIAKHYREQLKIIEAKRSEGVTGKIDFESWQ